MAKKTSSLLPAATLGLNRFGERLRLARLRRQLTAKQVAERAGMTVVTLRNLEQGGSGVTIGAYLAVMQVLGIEQELDLLAKDDSLGRELQDARLPRVRRRSPAPSQVAQSAASYRAEMPTEQGVSTPKRTPKNKSVTTDSNWLAASDFVSADNLAKLIVAAKPAKPVDK